MVVAPPPPATGADGVMRDPAATAPSGASPWGTSLRGGAGVEGAALAEPWGAAPAGAPEPFLGIDSPAPRITPNFSPTCATTPSAAVISPRVPAEGAGSSMLILSVMISTIGSSLAIGSPTFFSHLPIVPSTTLSPSCG